MKIVIDIPEDIYKEWKLYGKYYNYSYAQRLILNGTPLPKGYGRLIDLEEVRDRYINIIKVSNSELDSLRMLAEILDTAPTIIEADKGE